MRIYEQLKEAGCVISNYRSDLYVEIDSRSIPIVQRWQREQTREHGYPPPVTNFIDQTSGKRTYELPFQFDPFWQKLESRI